MKTDVLDLLGRRDKWYLGQAPGLIHAPSAPLWLDHPGFWDVAHFLHFPVAPVFTFALLDEELRPIVLRYRERHWRPDRLEVTFESGDIVVKETRTCGPTDVLSSVVEIENRGNRQRSFILLAWTAQPVTDAALKSAASRDGAVYVQREVAGLRDTRTVLTLALGLAGARSHSVQLAEVTANHPHFHLTPYYETLERHGLDGTVTLSGVNQTGLVYAGLEKAVELGAGQASSAHVAAAISPDVDSAISILKDALGSSMPARSRRAWQEYFSALPEFSCSDPHLTRYYWYRWYGLRLNTLNTPIGNYSAPAVAEGVGYFRVPIAYSAQCHMLETRWMHSPELAKGSFLNFARNQRADGSLPNHIHAEYIAEEGIYHADWGERLLDVHRVVGDTGLLEEAYPVLKAYLEYFYRERDPQGSGLFDHINQWESGQEYMSRYVWVDDEGDEWKPMQRRLKGLDASVYVYRTEKALAQISGLLNKGDEELWWSRAQRTREAILKNCWDEKLQAFVDLSPELERSGLVFAISFYPFFTDLVAEKHLPSLERHLFNPQEFWTRYPVPASPQTDPYFSAEPAWKGKRTNCPWNGRTWPMTNSHIAEAIVGASILDNSLRERATYFITTFIKMMFFDGDVERPNCFEHYNPETGRASVYRGIDDYQHSWVVDLLIKYVAGVRPETDRVRIDPLPFGLTAFELRDVRVRGHRIDVVKDERSFRVSVDGNLVHSSLDVSMVELAI